MIRDLIREAYGLEDDDVRSTSMGVSGEDIQLSPKARMLFPFSVEVKNVEKPRLWAYYEQAKANAGKWEPLLFIMKNRTQPVAVMDAKVFIELMAEHARMKIEIEMLKEGVELQ